MNSQEFITRLEYIQHSLFNCGFLRNIHSLNFSNAELAQLQVNLAQVATQTALSLQELDLKKQQTSVEIEKVRQDIEISIVQSRLANLKAAADAITACVQAESIKRSVVDNASINKANGFIQYFNVAMNAIANNPSNLDEGKALTNISDLVLGTLNNINDNPLNTGFDEVINEILKRASDLKSLGSGKAQVSIIAPKTTLAPGEPITLLGISAFGDNECEFVLGSGDTQIVEPSRFYIFKSEQLGKHKVIFKAKNDKGEWVSSQITLKVLEAKKEKPQCKQIAN